MRLNSLPKRANLIIHVTTYVGACTTVSTSVRSTRRRKSSTSLETILNTLDPTDSHQLIPSLLSLLELT